MCALPSRSEFELFRELNKFSGSLWANAVTLFSFIASATFRPLLCSSLSFRLILESPK